VAGKRPVGPGTYFLGQMTGALVREGRMSGGEQMPYLPSRDIESFARAVATAGGARVSC